MVVGDIEGCVTGFDVWVGTTKRAERSGVLPAPGGAGNWEVLVIRFSELGG